MANKERLNEDLLSIALNLVSCLINLVDLSTEPPANTRWTATENVAGNAYFAASMPSVSEACKARGDWHPDVYKAIEAADANSQRHLDLQDHLLAIIAQGEIPTRTA